MPTVNSVLAAYRALTPSEQNTVRAQLVSLPPVSGTLATYVESQRFVGDKVCPCCGSVRIVRNGKRPDGTQRFICHDCGKSSVAASNSIASGSRKGLSVWSKYVECMLMGLSLSKTAAICHIHRNTAFNWRHKILDALQAMADSVVLNGIVEADETFFALSYKGNHTHSATPMPRKSHHRGNMCKIRGLSKEKVCVPCAVNRDGKSIAKVGNLARVQIKALEAVFGGKIEAGSALVTDSASSYRRFSTKNKLDLKQVPSGRHMTKGIYGIQHINNYHHRLKSFMDGFCGVSTKYLNNYLIWNNFVNYSNGNFEAKRDLMLSYALCRPFTERELDIANRDAIPIHV